MKTPLAMAAAAVLIAAGPALAGPNGDNVDNDPGLDGRSTAVGTKGFGIAAEMSGKGVPGLAAAVFGDNGKGNGGDPDTIEGVELDDHDPGEFGGGVDQTR